ncbi:MAG: IS21 family transposase [Erysipelotrichaceae bacterium]|nr:IS21 family transposase [Smithella sp.]NLV28788.1 IS21 family transposase [Erysipelotrichaceae bacterium]
MVTDQQVRRLFDVRHKHDYQYQAADVAGMSSKTAGKYLKNGKLPSQCRVEHTWPTRQDPFADDWAFIEKVLQDTQAALEGKTLLAYLQQAFPGKYHNGQLRTLQRRIKAWKALYGPAKEVFFSQHYDPGQWSCSDFTSMNTLNVTIARHPFEHLFYHFVLCYSNWQAGRICFSESFESLSLGLQDALWKLGGVPCYHRTDNLTSAVHKVGHPDIFTDKYRGLAGHYGFASSKTNPASPHENGDIEKSNDLFKKAVDQSLIIRGSRDFDTVHDYETFLQKIIDRMNQNCHKRFAEEIEVLKRLPNLRYDDYETKTCKVGRGGTFRLLHNTYSAHSRLVGETVKVRVYADTLEIWYAQRHIETLPRLRGENGHYINYRHHIDRLVRKPGAFENYCYKEDLFPTSQFRIAYDILRDAHSIRQANKAYLKILELAAKESESLVNEALRLLIHLEEEISVEKVKAFIDLKQKTPEPTDVTIESVDIHEYDSLLETPECVCV